MIKLLYLIRRAPHLSREEFASYWRDIHGVEGARNKALQMRRYVQNHPVSDPAANGLSRTLGAPLADFDGVAEIWYESWDAIRALAAPTPDIEIHSAVSDNHGFVDVRNSIMWFCEEVEMLS